MRVGACFFFSPTFPLAATYARWQGRRSNGEKACHSVHDVRTAALLFAPPAARVCSADPSRSARACPSLHARGVRECRVFVNVCRVESFPTRVATLSPSARYQRGW